MRTQLQLINIIIIIIIHDPTVHRGRWGGKNLRSVQYTEEGSEELKEIVSSWTCIMINVINF